MKKKCKQCSTWKKNDDSDDDGYDWKDEEKNHDNKINKNAYSNISVRNNKKKIKKEIIKRIMITKIKNVFIMKIIYLEIIILNFFLESDNKIIHINNKIKIDIKNKIKFQKIFLYNFKN